MKEQTIRALKVEPKKEAVNFMLKNELHELQKAVDGYIELVPLETTTATAFSVTRKASLEAFRGTNTSDTTS